MDRFWSKVDKRGPNDCWNWTASKNEDFMEKLTGHIEFLGLYIMAQQI